MTNTSASRKPPLQMPVWHMPIVPKTYPDREPRLTDEEKVLMKQYVTAAGRTMTGIRARRIIHPLARFERPYVDTIRLISQTKGICIHWSSPPVYLYGPNGISILGLVKRNLGGSYPKSTQKERASRGTFVDDAPGVSLQRCPLRRGINCLWLHGGYYLWQG